MNLQLSFTDKQLKKMKKLAARDNLDVKEYIKKIIKSNLNKIG